MVACWKSFSVASYITVIITLPKKRCSTYSKSSDSGPSEIGTKYSRPLYKDIFQGPNNWFPIVLTNYFEFLRRGQPFYIEHNNWIYTIPNTSFAASPTPRKRHKWKYSATQPKPNAIPTAHSGPLTKNFTSQPMCTAEYRILLKVAHVEILWTVQQFHTMEYG